MFFFSVALAATFVLTVHGVRFTNDEFDNIKVGVDFNVTWTENSGPIDLDLMDGNKDNLQLVEPIASGISGEWYLWTPENIPSGNYSLKIRDPNNTSNPPDDPESNFSLAFPISGGLVTSAPSQTPVQSPLTPSPTDPAATSTVTPAPSSSSQLKGLSSTGKTIIGVVTATSIIVSLLCLGLWLRNIKRKKARGNHPLRTMSTDHANMSEHQNYPVLTPNKTHFAFVTQELPADPRSGRSPVYETKFDARTLDHYRQGRVKPPTSSSSSDEESLVKQISYPKAAVIQFRTRE